MVVSYCLENSSCAFSLWSISSDYHRPCWWRRSYDDRNLQCYMKRTQNKPRHLHSPFNPVSRTHSSFEESTCPLTWQIYMKITIIHSRKAWNNFARRIYVNRRIHVQNNIPVWSNVMIWKPADKMEWIFESENLKHK